MAKYHARRRSHGAGLLHRWRGGRHPQPGDGPPRGAGPTSPRSAAPSWTEPRPDHRLRRGRDARLPRLGHARQRGQRPNPRSFANAPLDEAVGRLVEIIRRDRPQVIVTYGDDQGGLPAPRPPAGARHHAARLRPRRRSRLATPSSVRRGRSSKLYYSVWSQASHRADPRQVPRAGPRVALQRGVVQAPVAGRPHHHLHRHRGLRDVRHDALLAHATQVDPTSPFWFGLPREVSRSHPSLRRLHPGHQPRRCAHPRARPVRRPAGRGQRLVPCPQTFAPFTTASRTAGGVLGLAFAGGVRRPASLPEARLARREPDQRSWTGH